MTSTHVPPRTRPAHEPFPTRRLERLLGKPAAQWTAGDLVDLWRGEGLALLSLMHVGGDGWLKALDFVPRSAAHLRDVLEGGERADGSSLFAGLRAGASDILLRPRVASAFLDPFAAQPTLALLCGHAGPDGAPLPQSPDGIVRAAAARVQAELGFELQALGEVEFFLGRRPAEGEADGAGERGYHATAPFVFGEGLRREALVLLGALGVPVKYGHAEVGWVPAAEAGGVHWEQHEVELALAPLPDAADHVVLVQWVLRRLAARDGLHCRFDPLLLRGHAGSGLHVHLSPVRDGRHLARRAPDGTLAPPAQWLIAGLVRHGAALMAFGNRVEGSFLRLSQGKETPAAVTWGEADRHALVRLPITARAPDGREVAPPTIEFRLPDGSAHPHLLLAGIAQACVSGRATPDLDALLQATRSDVAHAGASVVTSLPTCAREVADALHAQRRVFEAGGVFPEGVVEGVIEPRSGPADPGTGRRSSATSR